MNQPSPSGHPATRPDLDVNEVDDGLVIYDGQRDRVHYLNLTAGAVFALCNGERATEAIADEVGSLWGLGRQAEPETTQCLQQLRAEGLVS